jgi:hypothetical protein
MIRSRVGSIGLAGLTVLAACHHAPRTSNDVAVERGQIGDSSAFGARIVRFNASRNRATYELGAPAHVVLLAVSPGKFIEPLEQAVSRDTAMVSTGKHQTDISILRDRVRSDTPRLVDQVEYQRCVDSAVRARARPKPRKMVRDSTGRYVPVEGPAERGDTPIEAERAAERQCARLKNRPGPPAPSEGDRYLVLIASDTRMTMAQLQTRLNALAVTADDVPTTISAIADALYFDRRAVWSGYYARW